VTEYGVAYLKGKSTWQRAEALINIAHPDFCDELVRRRRKNGDLEVQQQSRLKVQGSRSNT
jgi:acyl-CoA hydrolase